MKITQTDTSPHLGMTKSIGHQALILFPFSYELRQASKRRVLTGLTGFSAIKKDQSIELNFLFFLFDRWKSCQSCRKLFACLPCDSRA
jgi:hypothetical protein